MCINNWQLADVSWTGPCIVAQMLVPNRWIRVEVYQRDMDLTLDASKLIFG